MADYFNKTAGTLSLGGKDYAPGEKMPITEALAKRDPTVDWWIRSKFVTTDEKAPLSQVTYIPTVEETTETGRTIETKEVARAPVEPTPASSSSAAKV